MSIPYKVIGRGKPGEPAGGKKKYYATVVSNGTTTLPQLIEKIQRKCSIYGGEVVRIIYALHEAIADEIMAGNIVDLEQLGSFYPAIKSEAKDRPEAVKSSSINKASINYRPSRELKKKIAGATFEKVKS